MNPSTVVTIITVDLDLVVMAVGELDVLQAFMGGATGGTNTNFAWFENGNRSARFEVNPSTVVTITNADVVTITLADADLVADLVAVAVRHT